MSEERRVLRWGGLAGILGGIIFIFVPVAEFGFVPPAPAGPQGLVIRYPEARVAFAVGETLNLVVIILVVALYLALYQALRGTSRAPALWGTALSLLGVAILAVQAVPRVAFGRISDLYHAPGATPQDQATLGLIWHTTQGIFTELDTASFIFLAMGFILLGLAMLRSSAFGKGYGGVSMVLGLAGLVGVYSLGIDSLSFAPLGISIFIILPILLGWKVYSLSRDA